MGWALPEGDTTPRPGAEAYLRAGLEVVQEKAEAPMVVLHDLLVKLGDTEGHFHAFVLLTDKAGCSLGRWWELNRENSGLGPKLVRLFEAALFIAQVNG